MLGQTKNENNTIIHSTAELILNYEILRDNQCYLSDSPLEFGEEWRLNSDAYKKYSVRITFI